MPRQERIKRGTGIYHVMLRGINHQDIFEDNDDYLQMIVSLQGLIERYDENGVADEPLCTIYSYCLMSNHVHLLIREHKETISSVMKRLGVAYSYYFNKKYQRNQPNICKTSVVTSRISISDLLALINEPLSGGMDILDIESTDVVYHTDSELRDFLSNTHGIAISLRVQSLEKSRRNYILKSTKDFGAGIRQLSRLTGVSFGVIQKL